MQDYQTAFIDFAMQKGVLKKGGPFKLKSGRMSPYFFNAGDFSDGESAQKLGDAYANAVLGGVSRVAFDSLLGPPYKGIPLVAITAVGLQNLGANKRFAYYRKEEKIGGEATGSSGASKADLKKKLIVGDLRDGDGVVILDDVITTGGAKYEAIEVLGAVTDGAKPVAITIAMNRQEIDEYGKSAVEALERETGAPVVSIITASDFLDYLISKKAISTEEEIQFFRYLRAWGVDEVRKKYCLRHDDIIGGRTVIPACDIDDLERFKQIVKATAKNPKIGGYKIGFELGYGGRGWGLADVVDAAKSEAPDKVVISDHQKAATDIPDTGANFAKKMKGAGVDAVILFPESGPVTQVRWVGEALQQGLGVIVGGEMTHKGFRANEGGWIRDEASEEIYRLAAKQGVRHFVVPGNRPERIEFYRNLLSDVDPVFFAPGFVAQGGSISEAAKKAGDKWHAIVGRAITEAADLDSAVKELTSQL